jgi:hypothetical protein
MKNVPSAPSVRKPTAYYATYRGLSGVLTRPNGLVFLEPESGTAVPLTPEEVYCDVVINGEVGISMAQWIADTYNGGRVGIACARRQEVG